MSWRAVVIVIGLCLSSSGCGIVQYTALNTVAVPGRVVNQCRNKIHEKEAADTAWRQVAPTCPDGEYSTAYEKGFRRGFKEHLDANGDAQPPGTPPLCYRVLCLETAAGNQAVRDWYAGYSHGVRVAQETGIRSWIVVPPSDRLLTSVVAPFGGAASSDRRDAAPTLPAPRRATPPAEKNDQASNAPAQAARVPMYSGAR